MFCDRCGTELATGQAFCASCGKPVQPSVGPSAAATPPPGYAPPAAYAPRGNRVAEHNRILAICWLVYSLLHLIPMLFALSFFGIVKANMGTDVPEFVPALIQTVMVSIAAFSAVGLFVAWGLFTWKPWGRMLAIVVGIINLINIPLGTALGIYTLWVLLSTESEQQYREATVRAQPTEFAT